MTNVTTSTPPNVAECRQFGGVLPPSTARMGRKVLDMATQKVFTQDDWNVIRNLIVSSGLLALAQSVADEASSELGDKVTISQIGGTLKFMRHEETWVAPARKAAPVAPARKAAPTSTPAPTSDIDKRMTNLENLLYALVQSTQVSPDVARESGKATRAAAHARASAK